MGDVLPPGGFQLPPDILDQLKYYIHILPSTLVAFYAILWYDYFCTLEEEMTCIWGRPMSMGKLLLVVNRYLPFADSTMMMSVVFMPHSAKACARIAGVTTWLIFVGSAMSELILMLRTLAIWQRNRWVLLIFTLFVLLIFTLFVLAIWPVCIYIIYTVTSVVEYTGDGTGQCISGDTPGSGLHIPYALLMASETVIVMLTGIKAWQHLPKSRSTWVHQLYLDGVLFYFYLLCISTLNLCMILAGPSYYKSWLVLPQRIVHSVLCNRVLFFLLDPQTRRKSTHERLPLNNQRGSTVLNSGVHTGTSNGEVTTRTFNINDDDLFLEEMNSQHQSRNPSMSAETFSSTCSRKS